MKLCSTIADISYAFDGCSNLGDIYCDYTYVFRKELVEGEDTVPAGVVWHYGDVDASLYRYFKWTINLGTSVVCDGLKYEIADGKFEIPFSYTDDDGNAHILVSFGADAFKGELRITSLDLPESVRGISSGAFADCTNITEVHIPAAMDYIYDNAFSGCTGIQTVYYNGTLDAFMESSLYNAWTVGNDSLKNAHWVFTDYEGDFPSEASAFNIKKRVDLSEYEELILDSETVLYADRDTGSEVLEKLEGKSKVYIISSEEKDNGIWYEVYTQDEVQGWLFIESSGVGDSTEDEVDLTQYGEMTLEEAAGLHRDKDISSDVIASLGADSVVYIISSEEADNGIWYEVYTSDKAKGWIFIESSGIGEGSGGESTEIEEETETEESAEDEAETEESTEDEAETEESTEDDESSTESNKTEESSDESSETEAGSDESSETKESFDGDTESEESGETKESSDGDTESDESNETEAGSEESSETEESSDGDTESDESSETEADSDESSETETGSEESSETEESSDRDTESDESSETEAGSEESSETEESSDGGAESDESTELEKNTEIEDAEKSSSEDLEFDESTTEEEESGVETVNEETEEVVIESDGEDIPEDSNSDIPQVLIEAEVKDESQE